MPTILCSLFFLFFAFSTLAQPIIYVTPNGAGNRSGTSWSNALSGSALAGSVTIAASGTQIWVAAGKYKPTTTTDRTASFSMASGVQLYGGFAGTESSLGGRVKGANETTLSGDIGIANDRSDNSRNVVQLINSTQYNLIDNFTIRDRSDGAEGSGIRIKSTGTSTSVLISSCRFIDNKISPGLNGGGALLVRSDAGATCTLTIQDCTFSGNQAGFGGAINLYTMGGTINASIMRSTFDSNTADQGGAISGRYIEPSSASFVRISQSRFTANTVLGTGGAIDIGVTSAQIDRCSFINNLATRGGGAIDGSGASALFSNCLFARNSATNGGAVYSSSADQPTSQTFTNCSFVSNSASVSGGTFYNLMLLDESVTFANTLKINYTELRNCIVWNNTAPDSPLFKKQSIRLSVGADIRNYFFAGYSDLQDLSALWGPGAGNINTDPHFVDAANGNFSLQANSPAINVGDPATVGLPAFDLAGQVRIQNGRVDAGAYEFGCTPVVCPPVSAQRIR